MTVLCFTFLSGLTCLSYELIWSRYLNLIFGASAYTTATVTACFMLGLALGSWYFGRIVDRHARPMRLIALLQLGVGLYGLMSYKLLTLLPNINILLYQTTMSLPLRSIFKLLTALIVLLAPTFLMGGTIPVIIRSLNRGLGSVGKDAGLIYAVNTLGGIFGAVISSLVLVRFLGMTRATVLLGVANIAAAIVLYIFDHKFHAVTKRGTASTMITKEKAKQAAPVAATVLLVGFGISGFAALSYEVLWTRILTLFFRDSTYDFALVLVSFLLGLAIGGIVGARYADRAKNPLKMLGCCEIAIGLFSILSLSLVHQLPYHTGYLQTMHGAREIYGSQYWLIANILKLCYALLLMIVPTVLFGASFPICAKLCVKNTSNLGGKIGLLSMFNSVGAAIGSVVTGFLLLDWLGIQNSFYTVVTINIILGAIFIISAVDVGAPSKILVLSLATLISLALVSLAPRWDRLRMSTSFLEPRQDLEGLLSLDYYREDAHGLTSVVELVPWKRKYLTTNRLYSQNTSDMFGLEDHRRLAHIPLLLHDNPHSVLLTGLGAGITLRGAAEHEVASLDCVEISPSVREAAELFSTENGNVLHDPRVRIIVEDGRSYMSGCPKRYDVIVSDIFFPMSAESSSLFSRDYFALCRRRLQPGGLFCQWLPVHQLSLREIKVIVKTFRAVFPNTSVWYGMIGASVPVVGCIGGLNGRLPDPRQLWARYEDARLIARLREVNLENPYLLLSHFIMAGKALDDFLGDCRINTDDKPVIEYTAPRLAEKSDAQGAANLSVFSRRQASILPYLDDKGAGGGLIAPQKLNDYIAAKKVVIEGLTMYVAGRFDAQLEFYEQRLQDRPDNEDLRFVTAMAELSLLEQGEFSH